MATKSQSEGPGHVYVMLEPMHPTLVKLGLTRKGTAARVKSLDGTGRVVPLLAIWDEYVSDPERVEALLHQRFADQRPNSRREFFAIPPQVAIEALMEEAAPFRLEQARIKGFVDVIARLRERFPGIIDDWITSAAVLLDDIGVALRVTKRSGLDEETTTKSYLDFVYLDDEPVFNLELTAEDNAKRLLDLDEYSLVMCTNVVSEDEAERIAGEQSLYRTALWDSLPEEAEGTC